MHAGRSLRYRIRGFGQPASQLRFTIGSDDQQLSASTEETITVAKYFAKKYSPLKYPDLPCIDARKPNETRSHWLPMEIVRVWRRCLFSHRNGEKETKLSDDLGGRVGTSDETVG